jgi:3-hydroxyacyl-[acyl-carrier-protein] dehydratase
LLLNNLYMIQSLSESDHQIQATLKLQADHAIFDGHFPGQPVLPGVCMMEMVAEITGHYLKTDFRISGAPLIKFLRMIDPQVNPLIDVEIKFNQSAEAIVTSGKIFSGSEIFMKFQINLVSGFVI